MRILLLGADEVGETSLVRFYFLHCVLLPGCHGSAGRCPFLEDSQGRRPGDARRRDGRRSARRSRRRSVSTRTQPSTRHARAEGTPKTFGLMAVVRPRFERGGSSPPRKRCSSWPHALRAELAVFMVCAAVSLLCAYLWDAPLKEPANPAGPGEPRQGPVVLPRVCRNWWATRPSWGAWPFRRLRSSGWRSIPYLDRRPGDQRPVVRWRRRPQRLQMVAWQLCDLIDRVATARVHGPKYRLAAQRGFPDIPQLVDHRRSIPARSWSRRSRGCRCSRCRRTGSTRKAAISLFTAFLVGFTILTYFATVHRGPNWDFYWTQSSWPAH